MSFTYRDAVLAELARHGVSPRNDTPPELVHDFINDLYRYEVRSLRNSLLAGKIPRQDYASRVAELRDRYPVLSLPVGFWTVSGKTGQGSG